jgi:hypothetical protein
VIAALAKVLTVEEIKQEDEWLCAVFLKVAPDVAQHRYRRGTGGIGS